MDLLSVLGLVLGSSVLSTGITVLATRKKTNAEINDTYADRLEKRIKTLETRLDIFEMRNSITMSAINCAYACDHRGEDRCCPVLEHIEHNPLPSTANENND